MKKQLFSLLTLALWSGLPCFATIVTEPILRCTQTPAGIRFTENKGQVHDQYNQPRPDVLFSTMTGNMAVHIKNKGLSYQLCRVDKYKAMESGSPAGKMTSNKDQRKIVDQQSIYRIDLNWLNHNPDFIAKEDEVLPGYNNYYFESCPAGALRVKSYTGITLINLYPGIDLHYYEKNKELKHDYSVAPHADYRQIQVQVEGAEVSIHKDGSLLLTTPLGKVQEGAPVVFQNAKRLKAKWRVHNHVVGFEVEDYDPNFELIIDPVTRLWGTYYGGAGNNEGHSCATDANGYVYMAGLSDSNSGTAIATSGSHQSVTGGGIDAFLVKFDASGVRQWATYYGGSGDDRALSCTTGSNGEVYVTGYTNSGNAMATAGSHQPAYGAGNYFDAFLAKLDGNGIRQWATYYGGISTEYGNSCSVDAAGNVYMAGMSASATGTVIATAGSHQSVIGGSTDAFLAKFNSSGVRQWATYYGGAVNDEGFSCSADPLGNVYLTGYTETNTGTVMATAGSHQPAFGGNSDCFLAKFNSSGVRQWATYYGDYGNDIARSCATDPTGNVYMAGSVSSTNGTIVATVGSHQPLFGGVNYQDAFLVKFDANGLRQWGTYYGGPQHDQGHACTTDANGNVYLAGVTLSNAGTVMATANSHQPLHAGNLDAYLAKFNSSGVRQWGTYYGGYWGDIGESCAADPYGNIYLAGQTASDTGYVIATSGSHQSSFVPNSNQGFLVKFEDCNLPPVQPSTISGPTLVCEGASTSYTTALAFGVSYYTLWLPGGGMGFSTTNTINIVPLSSGIFTLVAGNGCGASPEQTLNVTVQPSPTLSMNSGSICSGQSFTLAASGATNFTYSAGPVVAPMVTSVYTVASTNTLGCTGTAVSTVIVYASPTVMVNSGSICSGQSFSLLASGANTYTYSGGPVVSPVNTATYSVTGTSAAGCISSNTAFATVSVNALPGVTVLTTASLICAGESVTLTAGGALTYTYNTGSTGPYLVVSPGATSGFTVTGSNANGCKNTAVITQSVSTCSGIKSNSGITRGIKVYPVPAAGIITLDLDSDNEIVIINAIGQLVYSAQLNSGIHQLNLANLAKGVYVLKLRYATDSKVYRLLLE